MSMIPGWDSITGANWWGSFHFWASIVALILLGVFEVFSHRYGERHDELVAQAQSETERRHEEEIARLHLETAQATAEAAKLGVSFGNLHDFVADQERRNSTVIDELKRNAVGLNKARADALTAAEETKKTLADMRTLLAQESALRQQMIYVITPRTLTVPQQAELKRRLAPFPSLRVDMITFGDTKEIADFGRKLSESLELAGWRPKVWSAFNGASYGVNGVPIFTKKGSSAETNAAALVLEQTLNAQQISAKIFDPFEGTNIPTSVNGPTWDERDVGDIRLYVGAKP